MPICRQQFPEPQILRSRTIRFEPHIHSDVEIIMLYQGAVSLTVDWRPYELRAGDALIVFPNAIHGFAAGENVDAGKFIFNADSVRDLGPVFRTMRPKTPVVRGDAVRRASLAALSREILSVYQRSSPAVRKAYLLLLSGKLLELCELEENRATSAMSLLSDVFEYCDAHYHDEVTLRQVADAVCVSPSRLSHLFCEHLKINFRQYLNMFRVNEAGLLLRQTDLTIQQVAEQSGFGTLRALDRAFATHIGVTPKAYRKRREHLPAKTEAR